MWEARREARPAAALLVALLLVAVFAVTALATPGDLDTSFDGDGRRTIDYGGSDAAYAVAIQPDGRILLAGTGNPAQDIALTRLNPDGSFDPSFDGDGVVGIGFGGNSRGLAVALQANGKIVVAGDTTVGNDMVVLRLNADGSLDRGFDGDGKRTIDYAGNDAAFALAIQPDGRILLAGTGNPNQDLALTRLNPDGSFDSSFDGDGVVGIDFGGYDDALAMALQANGKIVVAGYTTLGEDMVVARFNADGSLDPGFDGDGKRTIDYAGNDAAYAVAIQPDGRILLAGTGNPAKDLALTRLNPDGSFDPSFDGDGVVGIDFGGDDRGYAMALQANGKIVAAGSEGQDRDFMLARFQPGGTLDTTFDYDGKKTIDFGGSDAALATTLQANGGIVVAGFAKDDIGAARVEGDPPSAGGGPGGPGAGGSGGSSGKPPRCAGKRATIVGTNRSERLKGTNKSDVIVALGGNDRIKGLRGNDRICAGKGRDRVTGGPGNDIVEGGPGNDTIKGDAGNDSLKGQGDKDKITGGDGRDRMSGGGGRDNCSGGGGKDRATCERERSV